jgi:hypothetical protein
VKDGELARAFINISLGILSMQRMISKSRKYLLNFRREVTLSPILAGKFQELAMEMAF